MMWDLYEATLDPLVHHGPTTVAIPVLGVRWEICRPLLDDHDQLVREQRRVDRPRERVVLRDRPHPCGLSGSLRSDQDCGRGIPMFVSQPPCPRVDEPLPSPGIVFPHISKP